MLRHLPAAPPHFSHARLTVDQPLRLRAGTTTLLFLAP